MDIESLETYLLASIAVPNHSKSPRKARLMPQPVIFATIPGHPDSLAGKIMVPEVSLIGASLGRQYKGEWALLTRHSADYLSDVLPHPLTYSKILWRRIKLAQKNAGNFKHSLTDKISIFKITEQHAVQTKIAMITSLPQNKYFENEFEFTNELGIMTEFKNDSFTIRSFTTIDSVYFVDEFTPRSIILIISYRIYAHDIEFIEVSKLTVWIQTIDQIIKLLGVIDSFYTDVLILQPGRLINPNTSIQYYADLKHVLSDRIEMYEAVIDLILLPVQTKLELAGMVSPQVSVLLLTTQDTAARLKTAVESNDPQQLAELALTKFKDSFAQETSFWFGLLQDFGETFWEELVKELSSKTPTRSIEKLIDDSQKIVSDPDRDRVVKMMHEMNNFALCQFIGQQRGAVHTISDAVKHQQLESMQSAYKQFRFIRKFRPPAFISLFGHRVSPLAKMRLEADKSVNQGLLPQPLFRRGDYRFTKVNSTQSAANYLNMMPIYPCHTRNLVVVKPGCYLDCIQAENEIFYKLVFIDRVTAADFELGRRARPNGLGNPEVVGGLDIKQLISTGKLSEADQKNYAVCCVEFSRKWIFMMLRAGTERFYLARMSLDNSGPAPCTLDLNHTMQVLSRSVVFTEWLLIQTWYFEPSRTFPLCYLEIKNKLLIAQPFGKKLAAVFETMVELQICLMAIDCTDNSMKVGTHSVLDSGFTIDSAVFGYHKHPIGHSAIYKPEMGFYFRWQLIEGLIFGVWLKNTHEYIVYALHKGRFLQAHRGKLRLGLSPAMQEYREILASSHGAYWLPFAIGQRTAFQAGQYISLEVQTFRLKLI